MLNSDKAVMDILLALMPAVLPSLRVPTVETVFPTDWHDRFPWT